ncbi:MAG: TonB-dependent siderophore receptor [Proteobacteria bacterium]|nr:TonB-dependent siderophore receptor [Pseudomonadota bacterium]
MRTLGIGTFAIALAFESAIAQDSPPPLTARTNAEAGAPKPQTPVKPAPNTADLPPVVVTAPAELSKPVKKPAKAKPLVRNVSQPTVSNVQPAAASAGLGESENPKGPGKGIVAERTTSGSKTDTPIIEIPQGISVVTGEQIRDMGAMSVVEATRYAPGIRSETFGSDTRNDWFLVRGFSAQETGYYLDGLQLFSTAFATWRLEPWGLDRIEIIRGPSSVLYGGGNPGGLINAVSKRPGLGLDNAISTGIDEFGNAYAATDLSGQLGGSGEVFYRLNMLGKTGGTQVDDVDNDRFFIAPSLLWRPNADTSLVVLSSYQRDKTAIQNFLPYVGTAVDAPFGRIPTSLDTNNPDYGSFKREQAMVGYEFEHRVNDAVSLRQNFRYGHLEVDLLGLYGLGYAVPPTSTSGIISRGNFITQPVADEFNIDNQAEFRFGTGPLFHKVLTGIDYKHYRIADDQGFEFRFADLDVVNPVYPPNPAPPSTRYLLATTTQEQLGVYLQDQVKIEKLTVALSGRHDYVSTDRDDKLSAAQSVEVDEGAFTGRAGAIYNFDNGLAPYVSYSTSFNPLVGLNATTGTLLKPETGEGWEGGVKWEPRWLQGRITLSYFDIDRSNVPSTNPLDFSVRQIGAQNSHGFEYEGIATLMPGLNVISSYTIYDLTTLADTDPAAIGKVPIGIPEQFGGVALDYTLQHGVFRGFGFGAGVRYNGPSYADAANTLPVPSYTLFDLALHYEHDGWRTALNVTNLMDDAYVSSCSGPTACFYGERRKALVSSTYRW